MPMSEKVIDEILRSFAQTENPGKEVEAALAEASGTFPSAVREKYISIYKEYHETDDNPYDPPVGI